MEALSLIAISLVSLMNTIDFVLNEVQAYEFLEVIIIDGHSTDKTVEIAKKYKTKVILQSDDGWGSAVIEGFNYASGKYLTYMDGDGSYRPSSIVEMKSHIDEYDAVFGSRYKGGAKSPDDTFIRHITLIM